MPTVDRSFPPAVLASWPPASPNPETKTATVLASQITMLVLLNCVMGARFYSRVCIARVIHVDDWLIIPGYICTTMNIVITLVSTRYGWGYHLWDVPSSSYVDLYRLTYFWAPIFAASSAFVKLSILLFYRRLFQSDHVTRRIIDVTSILITLWNLAMVFLSIFVYVPPHASWDRRPGATNHCQGTGGYIAYGAIDLATDVYLILLFQFKIWRMRLPFDQKLSVALLMGVAALVVTATAVRIPFLLKACAGTDKTWESTDLTLWSSIELVLAILCASAPALRAFFTEGRNGVLVGRIHSMNMWPSTGHRTANMSQHVITAVSDIESTSAASGKEYYASTREDGASKERPTAATYAGSVEDDAR